MHRGKNSWVKTRFAIFERNTQQARSLCIQCRNWRTYQALASQLPKLNQNPEVSLSSQHQAIIAVWDITRIWRWRRRHIWWTSPSIIKASTSIIKAPSAVIETPSAVIETSSSRWTRWTAPSWGGLSTSIIMQSFFAIKLLRNTPHFKDLWAAQCVSQAVFVGRPSWILPICRLNNLTSLTAIF